LEKRYEDDDGQGVFGLREEPTTDSKTVASILMATLCHRNKVSLRDIEEEDFRKYFHRTVDCPFYSAEKSHKK